MSDDEISTLKSARFIQVFSFHTYAGCWERVKRLKQEYPDLERFNFTLHDTRRVHSRALQEQGGTKAAADLLEHAGNNPKMTEKYAGTVTLNYDNLRKRALKSKQKDENEYLADQSTRRTRSSKSTKQSK